MRNHMGILNNKNGFAVIAIIAFIGAGFGMVIKSDKVEKENAKKEAIKQQLLEEEEN